MTHTDDIPDVPLEGNHNPPDDPLLARARSVAQVIAERVRTTLSHHAPAVNPVREGEQDRPLRVLVVDDNVDAADALAAVAELLGCEARACYGGVAAIDALGGEVPDVLLLDLSMPGVDGLEVAAYARALAGRAPMLLVATTALGSLEDRTATALAGFHFHLVKPVAMSTLRAALDRFRAVRRATTPRITPRGDSDVASN